MSRPALWIDELQALTARFSGYGIGPDMAGLTLAESKGLLVFLRRSAQTNVLRGSRDLNAVDAAAEQKGGANHG